MSDDWSEAHQHEAEQSAPAWVFSDDDDETGLVPAIPAATLVLLREGEGAVEALFVRRASTMRFAPGATVFPGGRVDASDVRLAEQIHIGLPLADAAARIAAIRETIEETGVAVGLDIAPDEIAEFRRKLHAGSNFAELVAQSSIRLDLQALTPFTRWRPNFQHARVFDTRFFIAVAPQGQLASPDREESIETLWSSARQLLRHADDGNNTLIFPTRRTLDRMALWTSIPAAYDQVGAFAARRVTPWKTSVRGEDFLCIRGDAGFPVTAERIAPAFKG